MRVSKHEARISGGLLASISIIKKLKEEIKDLVFPPMCNGCGRVDTSWCDTCLNELTTIPVEIKEINTAILTGLCATCQHTGKVQKAIQALKYYNAPSVAKPLGDRLVDVLHQKVWTFDTIVPVPLFADREEKRGYNQAYLLSQQVEKSMHITCQPHLLTRHRDTNQQVGLSAPERRENVKDAFVATPAVADKSILLIDDVVTTGATLDSAATALLTAGATAVYAITVSHA